MCASVTGLSKYIFRLLKLTILKIHNSFFSSSLIIRPHLALPPTLDRGQTTWSIGGPWSLHKKPHLGRLGRRPIRTGSMKPTATKKKFGSNLNTKTTAPVPAAPPTRESPRWLADPRAMSQRILRCHPLTGAQCGRGTPSRGRVEVGLARFSTLRSWLSQWSYDDSNADGPRNLAHVQAHRAP